MRKAIVYGNGESRIGHYVYGEFPNDEYVTWGCNAIYRDIDVMNLVSVDYGMQLEIYDSGYAHAHKCWFGDWNIIPAYFDGDENILIDKTSADLLKGSEIDYVSELIGEQFKITNPQTKSSCGCGVSFSL